MSGIQQGGKRGFGTGAGKLTVCVRAGMRANFKQSKQPVSCRRHSGQVNRPKRERSIMAQAIMDPEEVRRFAQELKKFNTDLVNGMAALQARFAALGDTWQDQEHQKFAEEFKQTMKALKKFVEVSNQHSPFLLRKAQKIEEYLNQH